MKRNCSSFIIAVQKKFSEQDGKFSEQGGKCSQNSYLFLEPPRAKRSLQLSIGDWVLCKRGLDGDDSYLILEKENDIYLLTSFYAIFLVQTLRNFLKVFDSFLPSTHKKKSPQKLLIIPLDHQFSVQQAFALWNWNSFKVWNFLIFEVVKLCRMKKYLRISMMQVQ